MKRTICYLACFCLLQAQFVAYAAADKEKDKGKEKKADVMVRAFVSDTCIIADEPFYMPVTAPKDGDDQARAKFLPLIGLVVGKLAELYINNKIKNSANHYKAGVARKDTRYADSEQMNLYRAEFEPVPSLVINAELGCMTIVAGTFKPETTECTSAYIPKTLSPESVGKPQEEWKTSRTDDSIANQLRRADICIEGNAKAVYEARFEFSKDGTAYRLKDAGYRVDSLLTTDAKGASRTTLYTLKVTNPSSTDQQEVLTSAWVNIGAVTAGSHSSGKDGDKAPWLKVPPLSTEARRSFDDKTKVPQEVSGEIEALQRALTRNRRQLAGMDQRIASASPDLVDGLKQERTRIAVQNQSQEAELDARKAEYQDLRLGILEFMPVTIEVAVTETESEKAAQVALADIVGNNISDVVGSYVGTATTGLLSKGLSESDIKTDDATSDYEHARAQYFDALVAANSSPGSAPTPEAKRSLLEAKNKYNVARLSLGLEQIK
jgi:hypothetical protein